MPDTTLRDLVLRRLDADTKPEDEWSALVLAAVEGEGELTKLLDEARSAESKPQPATSPEPTQAPERLPESPS